MSTRSAADEAAATINRLLPELTLAERDTLARFVSLLAAARGRVNLVGERDPGAIARRHVVESVLAGRMLADRLSPSAALRVADVGSGPGLPGLPVALTNPGWHVTCVDPLGKRASWLREAVAALGVANIAVVQARAEDLGHDVAHRERYDAALSRALAPLPIVAELSLPLVRLGGGALAVKSAAAEREIPSTLPLLSPLGADAANVRWLEVERGEVCLRAVWIPKSAETAPQFPRSWNVIRRPRKQE